MESIIKASVWQDITDQCTFHVSATTTGSYASRVLYNSTTKMIKGWIATKSEVGNQQPIITYPSSICLPAYEGLCGIGHHKDTSFTVDVRCVNVNRTLYSSHSAAKSAPIGTQYEFCVCIA